MSNQMKYGSLQFIHCKENYNPKSSAYSATIAIDPPTKEQVEHLINRYIAGDKDLKVTMRMGVAYCSKNDQYVKSVGRDLAMSRLKVLTGGVMRINLFEPGLVYIELSEELSGYALRYFSKSDHIRVCEW